MRLGVDIAPFMRFYGAQHDVFHADRHALARLMAHREVKYGAWNISFEMAPLLLDTAEHRRFADAAEKIVRVAELFTKIVLEDPAWQARYPWQAGFWDLVRHDPGYSLNIPCSRLDAFLVDGRVLFLELNTDGSSYMAYTDAFHQLYGETVMARPELGLQGLACDMIVPGVLETLLHCYDEFRNRAHRTDLPAQPVIGIMDWPGEPTCLEFEAIARYCREHDYEARVVSPLDAVFDGKRLTFGGKAVHLLNRRLLGTDYAARMPELAAVTEAYRNGSVCLVGGLRSQIAFSKKLFAFLRDPQIRSRLPEELAAAVDEHLPWTAELKQMRTDFRGELVDLVPFITAHRELFVLKPCEGKCGEGIHVGRLMEQAAWEAAMADAMGKDYVVQEFIRIPTACYPRFNTQHEAEERYVHLGTYVFGGKFRGMMGRTCAHALLSARYGERLVAVLHGR